AFLLVAILTLAVHPPAFPILQTPDDLSAYWHDLASHDATLAYRAVWEFAQHPRQSVALLRQHLSPAAPPDAAKLQAWLAELRSDKFAVRDRAFKELANLRELAEPALQKA